MPLRIGRATAAGLILAIASAAILGGLWEQGTLKRWLQARAVAFYLRQVQPHLPFEIEEIEADAPLRELLRGRIKSISATLHWQKWRLRLSGPIEITRPSGGDPSYAMNFNSQATLETADSPSDRSPPFLLDLYAKAPEAFDRLEAFDLHLQAKNWEWKRYRIALQSPDVAVHWKEKHASLFLSLKKLSWGPSPSYRIELSEVATNADAPLKLKPFEPGPELHFEFKAASSEALWDKIRLRLPLASLPLDGIVTLNPESAPEVQGHVGPILLTHRHEHLSWKTPALPIRALIDGILNATAGSEGESGPFDALLKLKLADIRDGTIESEGTTELHAHRAGSLPDAHGRIRIQGGAVQIRHAAFAARGVVIDLPFSTRHGAQATVSAADLYYKKAHARLDRTELSLEPLGHDMASPEGIKIRVASSAQSPRVPITLDDVPFELGAVSGTVHAKEKDFELETSLKLPPVAIEKLAHPLCIKDHSRLPPVQLEADLTKISLGPGMIDPDGDVTAHVFGGEINADQIGLYNLDTPTPEVDFNLEFGGIQLDQLCTWSGFGEMIGLLQGHAHDVTFQGWLPTHFDLSFDAVPRPHSSKIEMDPEAMHNLVSLFAGNALDHVPVIAHGGYFNKTFDPYFGWISRRLAGFDLNYFGLSLYSNDGAILLETHDPPDFYRLFKKHYIFWGRRFKMPLQSDHYPVVMDEHGVARIFQIMVNQAKSIAQSKREKDALKASGTTEEIDEDENDPNCMPPVF